MQRTRKSRKDFNVLVSGMANLGAAAAGTFGAFANLDSVMTNVGKDLILSRINRKKDKNGCYEIVGPLKPGDQVIVGGGPRPKVEVRSPFSGGRFRIG